MNTSHVGTPENNTYGGNSQSSHHIPRMVKQKT